MAATTLTDLYRLEPASQAAIQGSAGYAVFNNTGTILLLVSTARGAGLAVHSQTKQDTFMKMISAGAGLGVGPSRESGDGAAHVRTGAVE